MQEFDKLVAAVTLAAALGLILLAALLAAAAWRAYRNAQFVLRHLVVILLALAALLVVPAVFLIASYLRSS
jgi:hypothetical protein